RGIDAQAVEDCGIYQRVKYRLPTRPPLVSIIIPTRDRVELLRKCIGSLARQTNYPAYEIILVDNGSTEAGTTDYYASLANEPGIELLRHPGDFNFSRLCNAGVEAAHGEIVVLLNNDVEILDPDWLTEMVSLALRPDVGAVGARLWGPDGRLQHGGIVLSRHNIGSYAHFGLRRTDLGYFSKLHLTQNVSAVTAACLATRREVYQRAGGLNERELAIAFNDVDFCLRLRAAGLRVIWTPNADLVHYESSSRGLEDTAEKQDRFHREIAYMRERWGEVLDRDPFYNPNLSLGTELFTLALPPRIEPPWLHRGKNVAGTAPHSVMPEEGPPSDYAFGVDAPIDPIVFESELAVSGWLVQREGKPIRGIRATVRRKFSKRQVFRARRKRRRPDVAASFPELPDAIASGFLIEVRLGKGRSSLSFEVQDDERVWRTFHTAGVTAIPLNLLTRIGFDRVRQVAASSLKHASSSRQKEHTIRQVESKPRPTLALALRTRRVDVFATSKSNLFILEIGELVAAGFREAGCDARVRVDEIPAENASPETVQIVLTPHEYYNLFLTERLRRSEARRITRNVVLLSTEQPETGWFQSNLGWAVHARAVADINPLGVTAYRSRGLRAFHLPLGFHPLLGDGSHLPLNHREYDITFLGSMTSRRERFFAEHAPFFSEHRCHLRLVPLGFAKTKDTRSYLSVAARNEVLTQSKILLNVHYSDQKYFEWHRMLVGIANGCCIITEKCLGYGPLVPGKHFVMVESEDLIPSCKYFLAHPEECAAIANSAATFIQTELRQAQLCRSFLAEFEADLARSTRDGALENGAIAPDLADSNPEPLPPELMRQLSAGSLRHFGTALREDLRNLLSEVSPRQRRERPLIAQDVSPAELREAVLEKRRGYAERWQTQEQAAAEELPIFQLHENRAVGTGREPQLSVVITLYNYARYIGDCVTSIERAAERLNDALEVVIVNDASTDRSLREALRSATTSRLPIRIANKKWNTGLADARNKGVQLARGDYVFIMDADNLIFPNALKQLLDVLKTGSFAAAYSLLCRFRGTPANRVGLLSHFDWDPQILVQHPYIDAMAMFRREALLELSGYDNQLSQIGWFGWEDYDLWLRFALRDYPVGFVPNVLCLYRHHDTSMINTTNLFSAELVRHFMANYGELLDRFDPSATIFGVPRERIPELEKRDSRFVPTT
nr:glycosyltransferase [Chthoniobacterales bacterium]